MSFLNIYLTKYVIKATISNIINGPAIIIQSNSVIGLSFFFLRFAINKLIHLTSSASPSAGHPIGLSRFAAAAARSPVPLYALGGITSANAEKAALFGGFASVSAFEALL